MIKPRIIACDFDGTIVEHGFPEVGQPMPHVWEVLKRLQAAGHKLVLLTCREDEPHRKFLTEAVDFCASNGIIFRSVNCNHPDDDFRPCGGRKVYAHYYVDDRNILGFPGWLAVEKIIMSGSHEADLEKIRLIVEALENDRIEVENNCKIQINGETNANQTTG